MVAFSTIQLLVPYKSGAMVQFENRSKIEADGTIENHDRFTVLKEGGLHRHHQNI